MRKKIWKQEAKCEEEAGGIIQVRRIWQVEEDEITSRGTPAQAQGGWSAPASPIGRSLGSQMVVLGLKENVPISEFLKPYLCFEHLFTPFESIYYCFS